MRSKFIYITLAALTSTLLLFQNCGKQEESQKQEIVTSETPLTEKVTIRDVFERSVKLGNAINLKAPQADYDVFIADGECQWVFKNALGVKTILHINSNLIPISQAQGIHIGKYTLTCTSETLIHEFIFNLTEDKLNDYVGTFIVGSTRTQIAQVKSIPESQALSLCRAEALKEANIKKGVECKWGRKVVFRRGEVVPPKAKYVGVFIVGSSRTTFAEKASVEEPSALSQCKAEAEKSPNVNKGVECKWGSKVIFQRNEIILPKAKFVGQFIVNGTASTFATVNGIEEAAALSQCKAEANKSANVKKGVLCKWGSKEIFKRTEVVDPKKDGKLYVEGRLQRTLPNITRTQALAKCEEGKGQVPRRYNMQCFWGSELIFSGKGKQ